jgi:hypothetical protein
MLHVKFAGRHIILQVKGKVNRLAKETIKQKSNEYHKLRFFECVMVPEVSSDIGEKCKKLKLK